MNNDIGINRENLKSLILKIYNYRDKINKILNETETLIEETKQYYISEDGEILRKKFDLLYGSKNIILQNIKSYCDDLNELIKKYDKITNENIDIFKKM